MSFKLRDYQDRIADEAVQKLHDLGIVYLSMEVRCGKTFTSLAAAERYGAKKVLFVTKAKAIKGIQKDVETYGKLEVDVISMDSVHKVEKPKQYDLIIADEAHEIGGRFPKPSKRAKELKKIVKDKPLILMSGTPAPETGSQLFHQFWISFNSPFSHIKNFYAWCKKGYVEVYQRRLRHGLVNQYDRANSEKIDERLKPYFISFSQKEAGFQCEVTEHLRYVPMRAYTMALIKRLKKDKVVEGSGGTILADSPVKLLSKVHQLSSGTVITEEGDCVIIDRSKVDYIKKHFKGQRLAIYYKFKGEYQMLKESLGDSLCDDVEAFREGKAQHIALQIRAGSTGINLSEADAQVFLNIDFSAKDYLQSKARLQTQKRESVDVYFLMSKGGLEKEVYDILQTKKSYTSKYFKHYF